MNPAAAVRFHSERESSPDAEFALSLLMEKYREGQWELHGVFVDLGRTYECRERNCDVA